MEQNNQQPQQNNPQNPTTNNSNQNPAPAPMKPQQPQPMQPNNQPKPVNNPPKQAPVMHQTAKQSKKNLIISGAIVLIVLIILLVVPHLKHSTTAMDNGDTDTSMSGDQDSMSGSMAGTAAAGGSSAASSTTPTGTQSRADALVAYKDKMISVTDNCTVTPNTPTFKSGATILIDNDGRMSHTIVFGSKSYTVSGQHYTLSWLNVPADTLSISCDGKDTGADLIIQ